MTFGHGWGVSFWFVDHFSLKMLHWENVEMTPTGQVHLACLPSLSTVNAVIMALMSNALGTHYDSVWGQITFVPRRNPAMLSALQALGMWLCVCIQVCSLTMGPLTFTTVTIQPINWPLKAFKSVTPKHWTTKGKILQFCPGWYRTGRGKWT